MKATLKTARRNSPVSFKVFIFHKQQQHIFCSIANGIFPSILTQESIFIYFYIN